MRYRERGKRSRILVNDNIIKAIDELETRPADMSVTAYINHILSTTLKAQRGSEKTNEQSTK